MQAFVESKELFEKLAREIETYKVVIARFQPGDVSEDDYCANMP